MGPGYLNHVPTASCSNVGWYVRMLLKLLEPWGKVRFSNTHVLHRLLFWPCRIVNPKTLNPNHSKTRNHKLNPKP